MNIQVYANPFIGERIMNNEKWKVWCNVYCFEHVCVLAGKLHAGHDISDGGLLTACLEMAFAGNCSLQLTFNHGRRFSCLTSVTVYGV